MFYRNRLIHIEYKLVIAKGAEGGKGQTGILKCRIDKQDYTVYSTGKYIQDLVLTHSEKKM